MISVNEIYTMGPIGSQDNNVPILSDSKTTKNNNNTKRSKIKLGQQVKIVEKHNQGTDNYTEGRVVKILTNKKTHSRGIKVKLDNGAIGRIISC